MRSLESIRVANVKHETWGHCQRLKWMYIKIGKWNEDKRWLIDWRRQRKEKECEWNCQTEEDNRSEQKWI